MGSYTNQIPRKNIETAIELADGILTKAAKDLMVPARTLQRWVAEDIQLNKFRNKILISVAKGSSLKNSTKTRPISLEEARPNSTLELKIKKKGIYIFTTHQNNTEFHEGFIKSLQNFVSDQDAQLAVLAIRYKNMTAYASSQDYTPRWSSELMPYYLNEKIDLNKNLTVLADMRIQAASVSPLSNVGNVAGTKSAIVGHSQLELTMIPTPGEEISRMLITTGSCSKKNYSQSRAGYIASKHHVIGALIVEIDGDKFFIRHVEANDDGAFYYLDKYFSPEGISTGHRASVLHCGDIHTDYVDQGVVSATFTDDDSIMAVCKPENVVLDDVLDFFSANHHHKNDVFLKYAKHHSKRNSVKNELDRLVEFHNKHWTNPQTSYHYIASNHNDALTRWLNEADPKLDPENALIYHTMHVFMLENICMNEYHQPIIPNALESYVHPKITNPHKTFFHGRNKKLVFTKADHGQHGDKGPNGAKGTLNAFANTGYSVVINHGHSPGRKRGAIQGGTSSLYDLGYNSGYSSWLQCHVLEYQDGTVTHLPIIGGQWKMK